MMRGGQRRRKRFGARQLRGASFPPVLLVSVTFLAALPCLWRDPDDDWREGGWCSSTGSRNRVCQQRETGTRAHARKSPVPPRSCLTRVERQEIVRVTLLRF